MKDVILRIIQYASDDKLSHTILNTYEEIEKKYFLSEWKLSELESGHFVEAIRRFIELKLFGQYTKIGTGLPSFNSSTLENYEKASGMESYRIIIPRVLFSIYCIRNKRGIGHLSLISANKQDASFILSSCKWILAEIIRIESNLDPNTTLALIEKVTQRDIEGIWEEGDIKRLLVTNINLQEKILFLLFDKNPLADEELRDIIENKDKSYFKKTLKKLHADRLIEYKHNGQCFLSPKGRKEAESIILKLSVS